MKIIKIIVIITIINVFPCFAQNDTEAEINKQIEQITETLTEANKKLAFENAFLNELKVSEGDNSALIKQKKEVIAALETEVLRIKASLFELNTDLKNLAVKVDENSEEQLFINPQIISTYPVDSNKKSKAKYWHDKDIRNPIAFTEFIVRNPRVNGRDVLTKPSNLSSYNYIKPGSIVNILFNEEVYNKLNGVQLSVSAYLKRADGSVVPITVSGYFNVEVETNQVDFEKNIATEDAESSNSLVYTFNITKVNRGPVQAEINTAMASPQPEDKLIVTVINSSDGNISFTTTFEYEDYGWETTPSGGFSWVNTVNQNSPTFKPAGSSGISFHYKLNKGASFWRNFFNPSFGPELLVLQDANENTNIGLGMSVSTFLRTVKVGYGWYLVGENGKPYVSIGVNFVEGYKSISSILSRSKD